MTFQDNCKEHGEEWYYGRQSDKRYCRRCLKEIDEVSA